jgi:hypothetical protein
MKLRSFIKGGLVCFAVFVIALGAFVWQKSRLPALGEAPYIEFPSTSAAQAEEFLNGNFSPITNVRNLPSPVLTAFTERGGSRLVIVDPGEKFRATDVVYDATLPSKRLILAGVSGEKVFVHYEQGGIGLSHVLALFQTPLKERIQPVWRGYCGAPAKSVQELQSWVRDGTCSSANRPPGYIDDKFPYHSSRRCLIAPDAILKGLLRNGNGVCDADDVYTSVFLHVGPPPFLITLFVVRQRLV